MFQLFMQIFTIRDVSRPELRGRVFDLGIDGDDGDDRVVENYEMRKGRYE